RRAAPAEGGAQTGHRGAMSYARLVADRDHPEAAGEQLLEQVVLFVVERRAAQVRDRRALHEGLAVARFLEVAIARAPDAIGDHAHRRLETDLLPLARVRGAVLHARRPGGMREQLERRSAFRTQVSLGDRRLGVALDGDQASLAMEDQLSAADAAV